MPCAPKLVRPPRVYFGDMRLFAIALVGCAASEPTPSPPVPPPAVTTIAADAAVEPGGLPRMQVKQSGTANDDFPHRERDMRAKLADAQTCIPAATPLDLENSPDDRITLSIDALGHDLVICAQAITRRDVSVYADYVSYACWNIDPTTGWLTRRRDLGRSYYRCQDGSCTPGATSEISFDGKSRIEASETKLAIVDRDSGAVRSTITPELDIAHQAWVRGDLTYVGTTLFAHIDETIVVYDDHGRRLATLDGRTTHVVSDHLVMVVAEDLHGTIFDLASHATRQIKVPGCPSPSEDQMQKCWDSLKLTHMEDAVEFRGALYGIDNETRQLVIVDPKTYRQRSAKQLAICK